MLTILLFLGLLQPVAGNPATWTFEAVPGPDGAVNIVLNASLEEHWHLYATELSEDVGPIPTSFTFKPGEEWEAMGKLQEPVPVEEYDMNFAMTVRHHSGNPTFILPIKRLTNEPFVVEGELEFMVCNDKTCLPPVVVPFRIQVPASE